MVTERAADAESGLIRKQTEDHLRAAPIRPVDYVIVINEVPNQGGTAGYLCILAPGCVFAARGFLFPELPAADSVTTKHCVKYVQTEQEEYNEHYVKRRRCPFL